MRPRLEAAALAGMVIFVAGCAEAPPDAGANPLPGDPNHIELPNPFPSPTAVIFQPTPTRTPNIEATVQAAIQATMAAKPPATETPRPVPTPAEVALEPGWQQWVSKNPDLPIRLAIPPGWQEEVNPYFGNGPLAPDLKNFLGMEGSARFNNGVRSGMLKSTSAIDIKLRKKAEWVTLKDVTDEREKKVKSDDGPNAQTTPLGFPVEGQQASTITYNTKHTPVTVDVNSSEYLQASRSIAQSGITIGLYDGSVRSDAIPRPGVVWEVFFVKGNFVWQITMPTVKQDPQAERALFQNFLKQVKLLR